MRNLILLILTVFLVGCISAESTEKTIEEIEIIEQSIENLTEEISAETDLLNIPLTDVNSGETFKLSDFAGKVVVLETMAVWCPLCLQQQREIQSAENELDVVSISLDIDPNEDETKLKGHAQNNGFEWRFSVAPKILSLKLQNQFGSNVLNPTATPVLIIDKNQNIHLLRYGIKRSEELKDEISKYL